MIVTCRRHCLFSTSPQNVFQLKSTPIVLSTLIKAFIRTFRAADQEMLGELLTKPILDVYVVAKTHRKSLILYIIMNFKVYKCIDEWCNALSAVMNSTYLKIKCLHCYGTPCIPIAERT